MLVSDSKEGTVMNVQSALNGLFASGLLVLTQTAAAQVAVIVNLKSPIAMMTPEQVASVFMGKSNTLPSGVTAAPADLPESTMIRDQFYSKAAGKTGPQVKATWARLSFSGKATQPKELSTAAEVKKFVTANPQAVGYIEKSAVDDTVKVVLTIE